MRIAAYVDADGIVLDMKKPGLVRFYEKTEDNWVCFHSFPLDISEAEDLEQLQRMLKCIAPVLDGGSVFMVANIGGVPGAILESTGIRLWKSEGPVNDELDCVEQIEIQAMEAALLPAPNPVRVEGVCGENFRIDLAAVLKSYPKLNSRELLIPFMTETPFDTLEVICNHTPKWFETELSGLGVGVKTKTPDRNGMKVVLVRGEGGGCSSCGSAETSCRGRRR